MNLIGRGRGLHDTVAIRPNATRIYTVYTYTSKSFSHVLYSKGEHTISNEKLPISREERKIVTTIHSQWWLKR